ncbi:hypothetical protein [Enterococcus wangshanyuanii]|uniref:Uncharacterized protein n=1 Tax=Enterococcus wangshanyuanii TaxID=2005703 RepID=A0ABQ1PFT5_9ENTE|nr:hypothetical protein [Enterococcus wangshanyuanii]GGC96333.1 hypothetical protein GCM10011573_27440 [Enterococcus wangshanyuanii]
MLNFDEYNFEVIDIGSIGKPTLTINNKSLSFSNQVADLLSFPRYVIVLFDKEKRALAIKKSTSNASKAIEFSKNKIERDKPIVIKSSKLAQTIRELMKELWAENYRYEIDGVYTDDGKVMIFDLKEFRQHKFARMKALESE